MLGETQGQRALSGGGGAVDGDHQGCDHEGFDHWAHFGRMLPLGSILAPMPFINSTKLGKLVSIGAPSSMATGVFAAMPRTRKDMAGRWSKLTAISVPPFGG